MKVTKEIYTKVKQNKLVPELSKYTIDNIKRTKTYTEYRDKHCNKKQKMENAFVAELIAQHELNLLDSISTYYLLVKDQNNKLFRLQLISLICNVVLLTVIFAMIAWQNHAALLRSSQRQ